MKDLLPDLCDAYGDRLTLLPPIFRGFGGKTEFWGEVVTVRCPEDNGLVRQRLSEPGEGRVLCVDGGGLARYALLGDQLAALAVDNGWAGVVVFGYVRDVVALAGFELGVQALGSVPMKTEKRGLGEADVVFQIEGRTVRPGQWLYADSNGIALSEEALAMEQWSE
ncbi:putative 4-hydroxy-4-methyl-2-oxoglutarate aldolase [Ferrimonas marina]|uniref:4-hydroxy-4-methyl-2-oxoglutarate aldolase n=1 Tax=Ferrimonas marina TaxID=299255 RepID=A0A1M5Z3Q4_9GAMM|nr:putative 4-hydroxy-4-methyl-2-oxoglutarate aldolase [Ferrimonas marina]SHI18906.1 regulator of ribonuclease activity A [Ferrimonas marina]